MASRWKPNSFQGGQIHDLRGGRNKSELLEPEVCLWREGNKKEPSAFIHSNMKLHSLIIQMNFEHSAFVSTADFPPQTLP